MAASRGLGARSARLWAVGSRVTRTPSSSRSKTSASPPRESAARRAKWVARAHPARLQAESPARSRARRRSRRGNPTRARPAAPASRGSPWPRRWSDPDNCESRQREVGVVIGPWSLVLGHWCLALSSKTKDYAIRTRARTQVPAWQIAASGRSASVDEQGLGLARCAEHPETSRLAQSGQ